MIVNHWKEQVEMDQIIQQYGFQTLDSTFVVDISNYKKPMNNASEKFYFGVNIVSPTSFEYPECRESYSSNEANSDQLVLYPNPTKTDFSIQVDLKNYGGSAELIVETIEGKLIQSVDLKMNDLGVYVMDVHLFAPGSYIVRLVGINDKTKIGKLVKQ